MSEDIKGWNFRVVQHARHFDIREVYYDSNEEPVGWSEEAHAPVGNTPDDLKLELELMLKAFDYPVIKVEDLPQE
jgi:hypothetical protein